MTAATQAQAHSIAAAAKPATPTAPVPPNDPPGAGTLHLSQPSRARFAAQRASYPLKFLAPAPLPGQPSNVGVAYVIAYGGGLVAGDTVRVDATVDPGCTLVLLTQGSTKVYKHRAGMRPHAHRLRHEAGAGFGDAAVEAGLTRQRMRVRVAAGGLLLLLPDSVSPFRHSRYAQAQRIELADGAGALVLDWVNSGRGHRPPIPTRVTAQGRWRKWGEGKNDGEGNSEDVKDMGRTVVDNSERTGSSTHKTVDPVADTEVWAMSYYASSNEITIHDRVVARERMVLDNSGHDTRSQGSTLSPVAARLAPYNVYATALVYGPQLARLRGVLERLADGSSQFQVPLPSGLLWSYSPLGEEGGILRVAGTEVEDVRVWLRAAFEAGGVPELVGQGLWPRCI